MTTLCSKCSESPARPGQRYCKGCHAANMREKRLVMRGFIQEAKRIKKEKDDAAFAAVVNRYLAKTKT